MQPIGMANGIEVYVTDTPSSAEVYSASTGWRKMYPNEINELAKSLVKAQKVVKNATKDANNPHFKSKYANLESVWDAIREPFTTNGLAITQFPCEAPPGHVGLRTMLLHESGQFIDDRFYMPCKDPTNPQAYGSAMTYARRYSLMAVAGIAPEDDDGNSANAAPKVDVEGLKAMYELAFSEAVTVDDKKAVAINTRNSALPEPVKTEMVNRFGKTIKEML